MMVLAEGEEEPRYFSRDLMCPTTGISYPTPEPNTFSFNSPKGMCEECNGLGHVYEVNEDKIFPNKKLSITAGGIAPLGEYKKSWAFKQLETIAKRYDFELSDPMEKIPEDAMDLILYGGKDSFVLTLKRLELKATIKLITKGSLILLKINSRSRFYFH